MGAILLSLTLTFAPDPITGKRCEECNWCQRFPDHKHTTWVVNEQAKRIQWLRCRQSNESRIEQWCRWAVLIRAAERRNEVWSHLYNAQIYTTDGDYSAWLRIAIGEEAWAAGQMPDPFYLEIDY